MLVCARGGINAEADIRLPCRYITSPGSSGLSAFGHDMTGLTRSSDGLDPRRRRVLYRSWHRGMREMDLIMGRFAETFIETLSEAEIEEFERLIVLPDQELLGWVMGEFAVVEEYDTALFRRLRDFHWRSTAERQT
jgi:antitoxin CptB